MQAETHKDQELGGEPRRLRIGDAVLCERRHTVTIAGKEEIATDLTWRFLMAIVNAAPAVVSYAELSRAVWSHDSVSDETIAQRVRLVRQLLQDDPKKPSYIRTVRGQGYQLLVELETLDGATSRRPRRWRLAAGAGVASLVLAFAYAYWQPPLPSREIPSTAPGVAELVERANEYRVRAQNAANDVAIDLYEQALAIDPDNTDALLGLSFALGHHVAKYEGSAEAADRAAELADRVILKDSENASAWAARGLADDARGRVSQAIDYYRRALQLNPASGELRASIAYLLQVQGHLHDALLLEADALSQAPPSYFADIQIATALGLAGLHEAAAAWLERAERLRPDNVFLLEYKAEHAITSGDFESALALLQEADDLRARHVELRGLVLLALGNNTAAEAQFSAAQRLAEQQSGNCYACIAALTISGNVDASDKAAEILEASRLAIRDGEEWPYYRVQLAYLAASLGEAERAIGYIEAAVDLGYRDWQWLERVSFFAALQSYERFAQIINRIKLAVGEQQQRIAADENLAAFISN